MPGCGTNSEAAAGTPAVAPTAVAVANTAAVTAGVGTGEAAGRCAGAVDRPGAAVSTSMLLQKTVTGHICYSVSGHWLRAGSGHWCVPAIAPFSLHQVCYQAKMETEDGKWWPESGLLLRSIGLFLALCPGLLFSLWAAMA